MRNLKFAFDLLDALGQDTLAIEHAISVVDEINEVVAESVASQSHKVDTCIASGLLACNNVWGNVLAKAAAALDHDVTSDVAELVAEHHSTYDGIVVDGDLACKLGRVADDESATQDAIVRHVHVLHQQVVVTHLGGSS